MEKQKKILVIIAGGTIEALYSPDQGTPYHVPAPKSLADSAIPEALDRLGVRDQCDIFRLFIEDSKAITEDHLQAMEQKITAEGYDRVVVVQGTDTMPENARALDFALKQKGAEGRKVVFTGAMRPLRDAKGKWHPADHPTDANYSPDGLVNMKKAFEDIHNAAVPAGVYVEMGQGPWSAWHVNKHVQTQAQESTTSPGETVDYVAHSEFQPTDKPVESCSLLTSWVRRYDHQQAQATPSGSVSRP